MQTNGVKLRSDFLNVIVERGFFHQCSNLEALDQLLLSGKRTAYLGIDPTANSLHVGHLVGIMLLRWFQKTGHQAIGLIGGGTAKIGDPSGKDDMRQMLQQSEVRDNVLALQTSLKNLINNCESEAIFVNNDDWLQKLNYIDFLREIGTHFTVNRMLSFDSVKIRLERQHPLTFIEFNYMILQAYDFLELYKNYECILQMGGSDQWGNIINGVDLVHKVARKEVFGLTAPLLTTSSGAKMGKTSKGAVWLNADRLSPYDYWQFWRNTDDQDVVRYLKLFTEFPLAEIAKLEALKGAEINEAKTILANEATLMIHGEEALRGIHEKIKQHFGQQATYDESQALIITLEKQPFTVMDLLCHPQLALNLSRSQIRRLIEGKGIKINDQVVVIEKDHVPVGSAFILSVGKKNRSLIKLI